MTKAENKKTEKITEKTTKEFTGSTGFLILLIVFGFAMPLLWIIAVLYWAFSRSEVKTMVKK